MKRSLMYLAIVFFIIGLVTLIIYAVFLFQSNAFNWKGEFDFEASGQFGDFVGGIIGTFWSASGLILLYENYKLQKDEFRKTQQAIQQQIVQASIITMIDDLKNFIEQIEYENDSIMHKISYKKQEFFKFIIQEIKSNCNFLQHAISDSDNKPIPYTIQEIIDCIETNLLNSKKPYYDILNRYINKLKTLLYALNENNKYNGSSNMVYYFKSQLDKFQLCFIFYYSLINEERQHSGILSSLKELKFFHEKDRLALVETTHLDEYYSM